MKLVLPISKDERIICETIGKIVSVRQERMYGTDWGVFSALHLTVDNLDKFVEFMMRFEKLLVLQ